MEEQQQQEEQQASSLEQLELEELLALRVMFRQQARYLPCSNRPHMTGDKFYKISHIHEVHCFVPIARGVSVKNTTIL